MNYKTASRIVLILIIVAFSTPDISAQVAQKIGSNSYRVNLKAVLELENTTKGFLPPQMTTAQQASVSLGTTDKKLIISGINLKETMPFY